MQVACDKAPVRGAETSLFYFLLWSAYSLMYFRNASLLKPIAETANLWQFSRGGQEWLEVSGRGHRPAVELRMMMMMSRGQPDFDG